MPIVPLIISLFISFQEAIGFIGPAVLVVVFLVVGIFYSCCFNRKSYANDVHNPQLEATIIPQLNSDPTIQRHMVNSGRLGRLRKSLRQSLKKTSRNHRGNRSFQPLESYSDPRYAQQAQQPYSAPPQRTIPSHSLSLSASRLPPTGHVNVAYQPADDSYALHETNSTGLPPYSSINHQLNHSAPPPYVISQHTSETII